MSGTELRARVLQVELSVREATERLQRDIRELRDGTATEREVEELRERVAELEREIAELREG